MSSAEISDRQEAILALYAKLNEGRGKAAKKPKRASSRPAAAPLTLDDEAIVEKCRRAANAAKFEALYDRGELNGHPSASEADFALMGIIKFYTDDPAQIERIFNRSALGQRAKCAERPDYVAASVANALAGKTKSYSPSPPLDGMRVPDLGKPSDNGHPRGEATATGPESDVPPPDDEAPAVGDEPKRPDIEVTTERHKVVAATVAALTRDEEIYRRGGMLVKVVEETENTTRLTGQTTLANVAGSPKILALSEAMLSCHLTGAAGFYKWVKGKKGEFSAADVHPPDWLTRAVATHGEWPGIRPVLAVAECPYPRADGSIVEEAGYDAATKTLYRPSMAFPRVPARPTQDDARAAWGRIRAPIRQFPFEGEDDAAVYLAALLGAISRPAIAGPAPGTAVIGNKASCGKGLLIDSIGIGAHGRPVPTSSYPEKTEEANKVKMAIALSGKTIVHFDNLEEGSSYGNSGLDSALTALEVDDRTLGVMKMSGSVPLRLSWFLSGNNISPGKDAHRRWLVCNLVSPLERPEERRDIEIEDLRSYLLERRGETICAALTILRAHALAGRPRGDWAPLGTFEEWDRVIRGAVWYATGRDCCATRRRIADESPDRMAKVALLDGWRELPGGGGVDTDGGITTADALELVVEGQKTAGPSKRYTTLRNALLHFGTKGEAASVRRLGNLLRGLKGNVIAGKMFVEGGKDGHSVKWKAIKIIPDTPNSTVRDESDESDESDSNPPRATSTHDNYVNTCGYSASRNGEGSQRHSADSSDSSTPGGWEEGEL
jgi:hypothetical protein